MTQYIHTATQHAFYYPIGMTMYQHNYYGPLSEQNKMLYNSKELQDDIIAGINFDWYDYGARFYDPQIGRWHSVDPHAENYLPVSPYAYVGNNSIVRIDPDGRDWYIVNEEGYVILYKPTDGTHRLYAGTGDSPFNATISDADNYIEVGDESILGQLATDRPETRPREGTTSYHPNGIHYAINENIREVFNVFFFVANNSFVEWQLDGYVTKGKKEYVLATQNDGEYAVTTFDWVLGFALYNQNFSLHSHHKNNAGPPSRGDNQFWRDRQLALEGQRSPAPHYVYNVGDGKLYRYWGHYTQNQVIREVRKPSDLYRRLGF